MQPPPTGQQKTNKTAMENSTTKMAVSPTKVVRSVTKQAKKLGYIINQTSKIAVVIKDWDGEKVFSALKYSSGWSVLIDDNFRNQLKLG